MTKDECFWERILRHAKKYIYTQFLEGLHFHKDFHVPQAPSHVKWDSLSCKTGACARKKMLVEIAIPSIFLVLNIVENIKFK